MWYTDAFTWNENYSPELDELLNGEWTLAWASDDRMTFGARVHGNAAFDTMSLCWLDSVENRRAELDPQFFGDGGMFIKVWEGVPREANYLEGLHIFDANDPEFVEMGEARVHERVTSHLGDLAIAPPDKIPAGLRMDLAVEYVDKMVFLELANNRIPTGLHVEVFRQRLGLPYEWWGAPVDDETTGAS